MIEDSGEMIAPVGERGSQGGETLYTRRRVIEGLLALSGSTWLSSIACRWGPRIGKVDGEQVTPGGTEVVSDEVLEFTLPPEGHELRSFYETLLGAYDRCEEFHNDFYDRLQLPEPLEQLVESEDPNEADFLRGLVNPTWADRDLLKILHLKAHQLISQSGRDAEGYPTISVDSIKGDLNQLIQAYGESVLELESKFPRYVLGERPSIENSSVWNLEALLQRWGEPQPIPEGGVQLQGVAPEWLVSKVSGVLYRLPNLVDVHVIESGYSQEEVVGSSGEDSVVLNLGNKQQVMQRWGLGEEGYQRWVTGVLGHELYGHGFDLLTNRQMLAYLPKDQRLAEIINIRMRMFEYNALAEIPIPEGDDATRQKITFSLHEQPMTEETYSANRLTYARQEFGALADVIMSAGLFDELGTMNLMNFSEENPPQVTNPWLVQTIEQYWEEVRSSMKKGEDQGALLVLELKRRLAIRAGTFLWNGQVALSNYGNLNKANFLVQHRQAMQELHADTLAVHFARSINSAVVTQDLGTQLDARPEVRYFERLLDLLSPE